jgi:hypothetical protein
VRLKKYGQVRMAVIYDNPDRQGKPIYCFTRHLTGSAAKIIQVRCHRWDIEPVHERIQQFLGAEDSQLPTETGVRRHLTLVFGVNSLLKSRDSEPTHWGSANDRVPSRVAHVRSTLSSHPV